MRHRVPSHFNWTLPTDITQKYTASFLTVSTHVQYNTTRFITRNPLPPSRRQISSSSSQSSTFSSPSCPSSPCAPRLQFQTITRCPSLQHDSNIIQRCFKSEVQVRSQGSHVEIMVDMAINRQSPSNSGFPCQYRGPGNSVGIATDYGLDGPGIESRRGRNFPAVQTGSGAHPASCKMGTGYFQGVKCGRGVLLTTHPLLVPRS